MKSCAWCGSTKFGLIRHRHFTLQFCRSACKNAYLDSQFEKARRARRWLTWLDREPAKRPQSRTHPPRRAG